MMTQAELRKHQVRSYGRDYRESDDGYGDMEAERKRGWHELASWGRDGWNLGSWPYVTFYVRGEGELLEIVEGDRTEWSFSSEAERESAIDYLFLWYAAGERWAPLSYEDRERLEAGELQVDPEWHGPYRA